MDEFEKYFNVALRFLSYRSRSEKEVRDNLTRKKARADTIEKIIDKLKEQRFINDEEFVKLWVEQRTKFKPKSIRLIKLELRHKGIAKEVIELGIRNYELGINDVEQAKRIVENRIHKFRGLSRYDVLRKLGPILARRGFGYDVIKRSIDEVIEKGV